MLEEAVGRAGGLSDAEKRKASGHTHLGVLYLFGRTRETTLQSVRVTGQGAVGLEAPRSVVEILCVVWLMSSNT